MIPFLINLALTAIMLRVVAYAITNIEVDGWGTAFLGAVVLALANFFVRPVLVFLTLPLTILTLGLFLLIVNAAMLKLMATVVPGIRVRGVLAAVLGALLMTVLQYALSIASFGAL